MLYSKIYRGSLWAMNLALCIYILSCSGDGSCQKHSGALLILSVWTIYNIYYTI